MRGTEVPGDSGALKVRIVKTSYTQLRIRDRGCERFEHLTRKREPSSSVLTAAAVGILREEKTSCRTLA